MHVLRHEPVARLQFHPGFVAAGILAGGSVLLYSMPHLLSFPCVIKTLSGFSCPSCGSSRAISAVLRADIAAAIAYNPLFVLALSVAAIMSLAAAYQLIIGRRLRIVLSPTAQKALRALLLTLLLGQLVWRLFRPI